MDKRQQPQQLPLDFSPTLDSGKRALDRMLLRCYLTDLTSGEPRRRRKGARGLGALGPLARQAVPLLEGLLEDPDPKVRDAAAAALKNITNGRDSE
jgi:hypothetical protein